MKVVVLGATGMLGHMVFKYLEVRRWEVYGLAKRYEGDNHFNIYDKEWPEVLEDCDWVINCIGAIKPRIDSSYHGEQWAIEVNALFPHELVEHLEGQNIIQIATDCVYSGKKGYYKENDSHDALDVYGKTKSLGEVSQPNVFNIRCSIIGPELGTNNSLLEWLVQQKRFARVNGFTNHKWNGITTLQFAKICELVMCGLEIPNLIHIPAQTVTKATLVKEIASAYGREDLLITDKESDTTIDRTLSTDFPGVVRKFGIPPIATQLKEMKEFVELH
jgi:dTDP-4-dehydrorhamnose reductase